MPAINQPRASVAVRSVSVQHGMHNEQYYALVNIQENTDAPNNAWYRTNYTAIASQKIIQPLMSWFICGGSRRAVCVWIF